MPAHPQATTMTVENSQDYANRNTVTTVLYPLARATHQTESRKPGFLFGELQQCIISHFPSSNVQ